MIMYSKASAVLLLVVDLGVAFVSNTPAVGFLAVKNARTAGAAIRCRENFNASAWRGRGRGRVQPLFISSADGAGDADADGTPSWRFELDDLLKAASPWGSVAETEIIAMDLLKRLPEVAADVSDAARQGTLLSNVVLARGTEARYTVDGLKAVSRQLRQDILPNAFEFAPQGSDASGRSSRTTDSGGGAGSSGSNKKNADGRAGPVEGIAERLYSIRNAAKKLSPQEIREGLKTVVQEAENVVSRIPAGLYTPEYSVQDRREGFEVRRYAPYAVCSAPIAGAGEDEEALNGDVGTTVGSGEGFNTLAGYLFGNNTSERAMDMTTPVNIDVTPASGRTMSFVMPKDISAGRAPIPRDPRVGVNDVADGELLAVRDFPGFATDGEVRRQLDALLGALEREATRPWSEVGGEGSPVTSEENSEKSPWRAKDPTGMSYRLMQYNPPYTLPWLRSNAIAVKVSKGTVGDALRDYTEVVGASVEDRQGAGTELPSTASY